MTDSSEADPAGDGDDELLVERARAGDRGAFEAIVARYGDRVHDFCWSVSRHTRAAADATAATFAVASDRMDALRHPGGLGPWLFAIARREAVRERPDGGRSRHAGSPTTSLENPSEIAWAAAGDLSPRDRVLLALDIRQGLDGQALAEAIGSSPDDAYLAAARLRAKVERAIGALLVARLGRENCPGLDTLLSGWDGGLVRLVRTRVARHVEQCPTCSAGRAALPSPVALLAAMPLVAIPAELRARMLDQVAPAGGVVPRRGRRRGDGFGPPLDRPTYRRPLVLGGAAVAVVILLVSVVAIGSDEDDVTLAGDTAGTSVEDEGAEERADDDESDQRYEEDADERDRDARRGPGSDGGDSDESPADADPPSLVTVPENANDNANEDDDDDGNPALGTTGAGTTSGPGRAPLSGTGDDDPAPPAPVATTRRAPTTTGVPADLSLSTATIDLGRDTDSAIVTIRNDGDAATDWTAGSGTTWISPSPRSGTIAPGETTDLSLDADRAGAPEGNDIGAGVTVWAGGEPVATISVSADVARPPAVTNLIALDARLVVQGCAADGTVTSTTVTADVDDESGLARVNDVQPVVLEVTGPDGATSGVAMTSSEAATWTTELGPFASSGTVSWVVVATDPHGNETRSATQTMPVEACP